MRHVTLAASVAVVLQLLHTAPQTCRAAAASTSRPARNSPAHSSRFYNARTCRRTACAHISCLSPPRPADGEGEDKPEFGMLSPSDMAQLRKRLEEVRQGDSNAATELYRLMTKDDPSSMVVDFLKSSSPMSIEAMQGAVLSLIGTLPAQFSLRYTTTAEKFAALVYQLQMTGYMFRSAEYVVMLKQVLKISSSSEADLRTAFEEADTDSSGFLDVAEVRELLTKFKGGSVRVNGTVVSPGGVQDGDVREFLAVFDADKDAKVSWEEFKKVLGLSEDSLSASPIAGTLDQAPEDASSPPVSGTMTIELEDGSTMEVDAASYIAELKQRVSGMRSELAKVEQETNPGAKQGNAIASYLDSLPKGEMRSITDKVQPEVVEAMKQLVDHVVKGANEGESMSDDREKELEMTREALAQVCMWQLVIGYRLREAEAKGQAEERLGY